VIDSSIFRLSVQPKLRFAQVDAVAPGDAVAADIHLDLAEERFVCERGKWLLLDQRAAVADILGNGSRTRRRGVSPRCSGVLGLCVGIKRRDAASTIAEP
jgi:hypothetical protein